MLHLSLHRRRRGGWREAPGGVFVKGRSLQHSIFRCPIVEYFRGRETPPVRPAGVPLPRSAGVHPSPRFAAAEGDFAPHYVLASNRSSLHRRREGDFAPHYVLASIDPPSTAEGGEGGAKRRVGCLHKGRSLKHSIFNPIVEYFPAEKSHRSALRASTLPALCAAEGDFVLQQCPRLQSILPPPPKAGRVARERATGGVFAQGQISPAEHFQY